MKEEIVGFSEYYRKEGNLVYVLKNTTLLLVVGVVVIMLSILGVVIPYFCDEELWHFVLSFGWVFIALHFLGGLICIYGVFCQVYIDLDTGKLIDKNPFSLKEYDLKDCTGFRLWETRSKRQAASRWAVVLTFRDGKEFTLFVGITRKWSAEQRGEEFLSLVKACLDKRPML